MFTRCPSCQSVFRVTAAVLQMAEGDVRCGSCGEVFNALRTLVDDWTGASFPGAALAPPEEDPPARPEDFEFDVPEDEWQKFFISAAPATPARAEPALGADFESLAPAPEDGPRPGSAVEDTPMRGIEAETADSATWQAFLREVDMPPPVQPVPPGDADEPRDDAGEHVAEADIPDAATAEAVSGEPASVEIEVTVEDAAGDTREMPAVAIAVEALPQESAETDEGGGDVDSPGDASGVAEVPGPAVVEDIADESAAAPADEAVEAPAQTATASETQSPMPATAAEPPAPSGDTVLDWGPVFPDRAARPPAHTGRWLAASLVAALGLGAQFVHQQRDALAVDPAWGGIVRDAYARLGLALDPQWPVEAYEIRDMKAVADNSAPGGLDIVAEIAVNGSQAVGLPVLRVVLRDRWSNAVASGNFTAADYLAEAATPGQLYPPGSLIPVQLTLKDPGSSAQGYELDICMPNRHRGLVCRNLKDPFRR